MFIDSHLGQTGKRLGRVWQAKLNAIRYVRIVAAASRHPAIGIFPVLSGDDSGHMEAQLKTERSFCYQRSPESVDVWLRRCIKGAPALYECRFQIEERQ